MTPRYRVPPCSTHGRTCHARECTWCFGPAERVTGLLARLYPDSTICSPCGRRQLHCTCVPSLARARATWDNTEVGISDASTDRMCDALLVADTSREGVSRLEVSAP